MISKKKIYSIIAIAILSMTSCKKEEPIQCWGVVSRVTTTTQIYWSGGIYPDFETTEDTTFQCGITEFEIKKQCELNSKSINPNEQTNINIRYSYYAK